MITLYGTAILSTCHHLTDYLASEVCYNTSIIYIFYFTVKEGSARLMPLFSELNKIYKIVINGKAEIYNFIMQLHWRASFIVIKKFFYDPLLRSVFVTVE